MFNSSFTQADFAECYGLIFELRSTRSFDDITIRDNLEKTINYVSNVPPCNV